MKAFPRDEKAVYMQWVRTHGPETRTRVGKDDLEETLVRLRRSKFVLIDIQEQGSTFTSVWHRPSGGVPPSQKGAELTMVVWKGEGEDAFTAVMTWRL